MTKLPLDRKAALKEFYNFARYEPEIIHVVLQLSQFIVRIFARKKIAISIKFFKSL